MILNTLPFGASQAPDYHFLLCTTVKSWSILSCNWFLVVDVSAPFCSN